MLHSEDDLAFKICHYFLLLLTGTLCIDVHGSGNIMVPHERLYDFYIRLILTKSSAECMSEIMC